MQDIVNKLFLKTQNLKFRDLKTTIHLQSKTLMDTLVDTQASSYFTSNL